MIHVKWYSKCMTSSYLCTETCIMKTCVNVCLIFCFEKDGERKQKQMRSCTSVVGKYYVRDLMQVFNVHSGLQIYSQKFLRVLKFLHPCWRCRCWIFWMNSWSFGVDYIKDCSHQFSHCILQHNIKTTTTAEAYDTHRPTTMLCSPGKSWFLAFMWIGCYFWYVPT